MPDKIKMMLKTAGFKKKDLKKKESAIDIFAMLLSQLDLDGVQVADSKPFGGS